MNALHTFAWGSLTGFCVAVLLMLPAAFALHRCALAQGRIRAAEDRAREVAAIARKALSRKSRKVDLCGGPLDGSVVEASELTDLLLIRGPTGDHIYSMDPGRSKSTRLPAYKYLRSA